MPKALNSKLIAAIRKAYIERETRQTIKALAAEFEVGEASLFRLSKKEQWVEKRKKFFDATGVERVKEFVKIADKIDDRDLLDKTISLLATSAAATEPRSQEGCANALSALLKTKRDLYPPTVDELADIAIAQGISAFDFLEAIKRRWGAEHEAKQAR